MYYSLMMMMMRDEIPRNYALRVTPTAIDFVHDDCTTTTCMAGTLSLSDRDNNILGASSTDIESLPPHDTRRRKKLFVG